MDYITFVKYCCKLLKISMPRIFIRNGNNFTNIYNHKSKSFSLPQGVAATTDDGEVFIDFNKSEKRMEYFYIAHELRHIYQIKVIESENAFGSESEETFLEWVKCREDYKRVGESNYDSQSMEIDANAFAQVVFGKLFDKTVDVRCDKELFYKKVKELGKKYA